MRREEGKRREGAYEGSVESESYEGEKQQLETSTAV
jgi:hypothetical protein